MSDDIYGTVQKNGTVTCLARIVGEEAAAINQSCISTVSYSVFLLDERDPDSRTVISGHDDVSLEVAAVIFNSMQTDPRWTVDDIGYNFRHTIDVSSNNAFTVAGRSYLVEYRLMPVTGQVILARFRLNCI
ncbi:MAG: hypothetical protein JXM70_13800 [Pirellulales bacterium]|nr:hypothetical protein [Pirellulales bacterium]